MMKQQFLQTPGDQLKPIQCSSCLTQTIYAHIDLVWSLVCRFDKPQTYKRFIHSCCMIEGDGAVGSVRELDIVTGPPATYSVERLDELNDETHVMSFSIVGGDHRLANYKSTVSLQGNGESTVVTETYLVDVPNGNTDEETKLFIDTIIKCNLKSLAEIAKSLTEITEYSK